MRPKKFAEEAKASVLAPLYDLSIAAFDRGITDLYLRPDDLCYYRRQGKLHLVDAKWDVAYKTRPVIAAAQFNDVLAYLYGFSRERAKEGHGPFRASYSLTKVYYFMDCQVRIHHCPSVEPPTLQIRIQPANAFPLPSYFDALPGPTIYGAEILKVLAEATGLILVCGPIGGGKTTLQQAIIEHWAKGGGALDRHVMLLADPLEYYPDSDEKSVYSIIECSMTSVATNSAEVNWNGTATISRPSITSIIPDVLRSDIDALSVGEIRDVTALDACMRFGATKEPVVATIHAASIAECVVNVIGMAEKCMSPSTARLLLASCLEGIFYVNLAYTNDGKAVPVVEYVPIEGTVRKAISSPDPIQLVQLIENEQRTNVNKTAYAIGREKALRMATQRGLTKAQAERALGKLSLT